MARIHTRWSATCSVAGATKRLPSTWRCSMARPSAMCRAPGWSTPGEDVGQRRDGHRVGDHRHRVLVVQAAVGAWNDALIDRIGLPCWIACTRRVENDRPSRIRSTLKVIGWVSSPGRMK